MSKDKGNWNKPVKTAVTIKCGRSDKKSKFLENAMEIQIKQSIV